VAWRSRGLLVPPIVGDSAGARSEEPRLWSCYWDAAFIGRSRRLDAGWASDDELRFRGSSGGAATALLIDALESGFIDAAIVTSVDPEDPLRTLSLIATDGDVIRAARGSKYTIASPNRLLRTILERDGRYALVGLPCHIEGLRKAQKLHALMESRVVLAVGLFCGTTCTPRGTLVGIRRMGIDPGEVASVAYRGDGWPGGLRLALRSGEQVEAPYPDYFDPWLSAHVPGRCMVCPDATNELADIAFRDAWLERFRATGAGGASFLMVRSPVALRLVEELGPRWLHLEEADEADLLRTQAETHRVKGAGVRGQMWLRSVMHRQLPSFPGLDFTPLPGERRAALQEASRQVVFRMASRLRYRDCVQVS
jgi:coenzyme F420 hydrogenase subunit beta